MNEHYDQASQIDGAIDAVLRRLRRAGFDGESAQHAMTLQQRLEDAVVQRRQIQEDYSRRIADLRERHEQRADALRQQHEAARQSFEDEWSRPDRVLRFSKPSSSLLQVRQMQKSLAISHRFDQAKALKREGDQLQRAESAVAGERATDAMKIAYAALLEKEERERECLRANGERKMAVLEGERERKLTANWNLKCQLEVKKGRPGMPFRPTVTVPQVGGKKAPPPHVPGVISVRTRVQYLGFKKALQSEKLDVQIGDVAKITKEMTPSGKGRSGTGKGMRSSA
jgi:hypothetical protein